MGRDMARLLAQQGYDLFLVARRTERMEELARTVPSNVRIFGVDLSDEAACLQLCDQLAEERIDVLINNAGFGIFGPFLQTDLSRELKMMDVNMRAVHIFTKAILPQMVERDAGYILNVASSAAFLPGPLLSSYYASKAYVLHLTEAIFEELRKQGSHVHISALCPGPVRTEFDQVAHVHFSLKGLASEDVARYALKKLWKGKRVIIPGFTMKCAHVFQKLLPTAWMLPITYRFQKRKQG